MPIPRAQGSLEESVLPSSSSPDLVLVPATLAEYEQTWHLNADEWRGPLTLTQYFERERFLINQDLTKNNNITAWILTSTKLPANEDGTRPILASVESLLKSGYVARNGKVDNIRTHGVASVYTSPQYRGRGYAGRMMTELAKQLETYQQHNGDRGTFSVLFSDIGKTFYARYGWHTFPSTHIHLKPLGVEAYQEMKPRFPVVHDITSEDLNKLPATQYVEANLIEVSKQNPNVPCVALRPDLDHFGWHHAREEISSKLMGLPFPRIKGAVHNETGMAIVWTRIFASKEQEWKLCVLHIVIPPALQSSPTNEARNALAALLLRAQHEASVWNMAHGVDVWDPSELVVSAAQELRTEQQEKVEIIHRDKDHICALRWTGDRAGDDTAKNVIWVNAEKYTWN